MFCCCRKQRNEEVLIPSDCKRNERVIISSSRSSSSAASGSKNHENYEPPRLPETDLAQRLSLPTSSAQKDGKKISLAKHRKKAGFVKKKGHLVKNWKKRYLVLKGRSSVLANRSHRIDRGNIDLFRQFQSFEER
jgi:hypothetical protein